MKLPALRITWLAGIFSVVVLSMGSLITALAYVGIENQRYSPLNHWVSELGQVGVSSLAGLFNASLVIGGIGLIVLLVGVAVRLSLPWSLLVGISGVVMGATGAGIGLIPMNDLRHGDIALLFFNASWITVALFSLAIALTPTMFPRWLIALGGVVVVLSALFLVIARPDVIAGLFAMAVPPARDPIRPVTLVEWLVITALLSWVLAISLVLRQRDQTDLPVIAAVG